MHMDRKIIKTNSRPTGIWQGADRRNQEQKRLKKREEANARKERDTARKEG